jgi:ABC-type phosphate/phosphonate transport system substrate-binding protein
MSSSIQGQSISLPATYQLYLRLFVEHECQANGKDLEKFFAKVARPDNTEDAIDDVVDGVTQVTVADKAALDAFKRRKPARFAKLKEVAKSQPFPPVLVACCGKFVDDKTVKRFQDGLLGASQKAQGQTVLTLFRMTEFQPVPDDFGKVLAQTRKTFPAPPLKAK